MDKQKIRKKLLDRLDELYSLTLKSFEELRKGSNEAPGAMQSHSDTTKFQIGRLADEAADRMSKIKTAINTIQQFEEHKSTIIQIDSIAEINENGKLIIYYIVPEAAGGEKLDLGAIKINTISISSPIGRALINKKVGEIVELLVPKGIRRLEILNIE